MGAALWFFSAVVSLQQRSRRKHVLRLFDLCLMFGFRGKYRLRGSELALLEIEDPALQAEPAAQRVHRRRVASGEDRRQPLAPCLGGQQVAGRVVAGGSGVIAVRHVTA